MSKTTTLRLPKELTEWLEYEAKQTGVSKGRLVREALEAQKNRTKSSLLFMQLAGSISGPKDLSSRKGFSKK